MMRFIMRAAKHDIMERGLTSAFIAGFTPVHQEFR